MTIYRHRLPSPAITVLMPAFNADRFIQQSVNSVLSQTFEDFELLVIDDASTDKTATILDGIRDSRLHVLRNASNLGIVGSLNRGITEARGRLVARTDADDICRPNRFARQVAFLDQNPAVLIAGAGMANMERGQIGPSRRTAERDPAIMRWLLHLSNPVGHPSMMFRTEVVERLGGYLRREFEDAEDFDFCHRVLRHGEVAVMPETLMLYRLHTQNITRVRQAQVIARASTVLCGVYRELIGRPAEQEGALVASHLLAGVPVPNSTVLRRLGATMDVLLDAFLGKYALNTDQRAQCEQHSARIWWGAIQTAYAQAAPST